MDYYIYNTLTRKKELFTPINKNEVKLYTCGPTVYNYAHIGNLRTYIFEDLLKKSLEYNGYKVTHVMNVTDVGHLQHDDDTGEDKMSLGAKRENKTVWEIARFYEDAFFNDCKKLNIKNPSIICRATEHIDDMIALIKKLEENGYTYISNGNVYFEISKFDNYGKLVSKSIEEMASGLSRVDLDENKKNPLDFVLWFTESKFKNQIMQWDSPWGRGFPGWHIECSAMSMKYLGNRIDIHCGGIDHVPIHHTNEIAQSEAATGENWVNYWIHGEFLVEEKESSINENGEEAFKKMSKSSGEFLTVDNLIKNDFSPLDYRFFCIQSNYRKQLSFSYKKLEDAKKAYNSLKSKIIEKVYLDNLDFSNINTEKIEKYDDSFKKCLCNDLNMPNALEVLYKVINDESLTKEEKYSLISSFDKLFSLDLLKIEEKEIDDSKVKEIENLINLRNQARKNKDFKEADRIRNMLLDMGLEIKDTKDGTEWKLK